MCAFRKLVPALFVAWSAAPMARAQCELQLQELAPPDGQPGDTFGYRMARTGDLAVMAAPFDDDRGEDAGSVYVYERDPVAGWRLEAKLLASNGAAGDLFGWAVAIAGTTVLVGAPAHDAPLLADRGMVYAFERDRSGTWREVSRLVPPSGGASAQYGLSLAARGDRLLVGMPYTGVPLAGHAFLYARDPSTLRGWRLEQELVAADPATGFDFGHTVALQEDVLAVAGATASMLPYADTYVVHVFERAPGGAWTEVRSLDSPTGTLDIFGYRISLTEDALAVVAPAELSPSFLYGAVYLYSRGPGGPEGWGLARRLYSPDDPDGAFTAEQCVLSGDWLVAGVPGAGTTGSVHVFGRNVGGPDTWGEVALLHGQSSAEYSGYGQALALEGDELLVAQSGYYFTESGGEAAPTTSRTSRSSGVATRWAWTWTPTGRTAVLGGTFVATVNLRDDRASARGPQLVHRPGRVPCRAARCSSERTASSTRRAPARGRASSSRSRTSPRSAAGPS
jgi:hypothetical protein